MLIGTTLFIILIIGLLFRTSHFGAMPDLKNNIRIKESENFNGKEFQNLGNVQMSMSFRKGMSLLPKMFKGKKDRKPPRDLKLSDKNLINFDRPVSDFTRVTWFGHSALMVDIDEKKLLLDPMLTKYASPFDGFVKRFKNAIHFNDEDFEKLGDIDAIIISHDHYDHLDYQTISKLNNQVSHFFCPLGVGSHLIKWRIDKNKITELDWWEEAVFEKLKLVCTPSQHFSGRRPEKRNYTLWSSWVIKSSRTSLFFSGDTGYFKGLKEIGKKYGPFDLAMLECGQYNELWKEIHMLPKQTIVAAKDLQASKLLPIHNMAFSLALHPWFEPKERVTKEAKKQNVVIMDVLPGESFLI